MPLIVFKVLPGHSKGPSSFFFRIKELSSPCVCKAFHLAFYGLEMAGLSLADISWFNRALDQAARGFSSQNVQKTLALEVEK